MSSSDDLMTMYDDYYTDGRVANKREIASVQTFGHLMRMVPPGKVDSVLDIGAGDGAVLDKLYKGGFGASLAAVEISNSGIDAIGARKIPNLRSVHKFDGYRIPHSDGSFDFGLAIHVLEHVEHERLFLKEASRVCKKLYVEVPLELTRNLERSIAMSGPYGHINFYTPVSFENLLKTSGLTVERTMVFAHDLAYEQYLAGSAKGRIKYSLRSAFLKIAPKLAVRNFVYMAGAVCSTQTHDQ